MRKFFIMLRKVTTLRWRIARRRRQIMADDIVVPGALVLEMLEAAQKSRAEAQKYERKPDAERLDGEVKVLTWLLNSYGRSKDQNSE